VERSEQAVQEFTSRTFERQQWVGLFIDGKSLAGEQMIIALGVTDKGAKKSLAVTQSSTEKQLSNQANAGWDCEQRLHLRGWYLGSYRREQRHP
jgi:transposase-like protein